mmetsp:Transcript_18252/g.34760  ORF Transcript_18252/g.34760 Transcript_18252/m.34760 type:complete len:204 (-) Transcript_18252:2635-3246(-)
MMLIQVVIWQRENGACNDDEFDTLHSLLLIAPDLAQEAVGNQPETRETGELGHGLGGAFHRAHIILCCHLGAQPLGDPGHHVHDLLVFQPHKAVQNKVSRIFVHRHLAAACLRKHLHGLLGWADVHHLPGGNIHHVVKHVVDIQSGLVNRADNGAAMTSELLAGLHDLHCATGVQSARRLVQHHNCRVFQQCAPDGYAALFAA